MISLVQSIKQRFGGNITGDIAGGLMAAIIALPLCLAFGVASGLGAASGLYSAIACGIFAGLFGGTPGQCSGPTGPMTVVAASLVAANPDRPELLFAAVIVAGILLIAGGRFKFGQLIHYIPYPVISGFMTGIGLIIVCIEVHPLCGLPGSGNVLNAIQRLTDLQGFSFEALLIGIFTLSAIYLLPLISKRLPASLLALVAVTWFSQAVHLNIPTIGEIPMGLPAPSLPTIELIDVRTVLQGGLTLALLGAIDSLLTSLVLDRVVRSRHDSNQELIGQGIGNIISGLIGGLPGAGATMRSMVNVRAGGRTYLSSGLHGVILLLVLLGLHQVASLIPLSALAAVLISVGLGIMDWRSLRRIGRMPRSDTVVMSVVLALTVFVDLIVAVLVGTALASVLFVKRLADAEVSSLGSLDSLAEYRQHAEQIPREVRETIHTYHFNGPLFFGEAKNLISIAEKLSQARYIILRFYNVPFIDQTGAYALEDVIEKWEQNGIKVLFVGLQPHVKQTLEAVGTIHKIDMQNCFDRFEDAIEAIREFEKKSSSRLRKGSLS
jgi:SulP family sulfate permease